MLNLKLELTVCSCEKSTNNVMGKVTECADNLRKNVSRICCYFVEFYLKAITAKRCIFFGRVMNIY